MKLTDFLWRNWRLSIFSILALGAAWIGISAVYFPESTNGHIPAPQEGFLAPEIELETLDGARISLTDLRGRAVLVNFWGTWCPPCRQEMPAMQEIYQSYRDEGFTILAVNAANQEKIGAVEQFASTYRLSFPILLDHEGLAAQSYRVSAFPTSYFIDPQGIIQEVVIGGPMAEVLLRSRVENLLEGER